MALQDNIALQVNSDSVLPNPLALLTQMEQIRHAKEQNFLLKQTNLGREAEGEALTAATGPDGAIDQGQVRALLAGDPRAQVTRGELMASSLTRQQQALQAQQAQTQVAAQRLAIINPALGSLIEMGPEITISDVRERIGFIGRMIGDEKFLKDMLLETASWPKSGPLLLEKVQQALASGLSAQEQITARAVNADVNTGGTIEQGVRNTLRPGEPPTTTRTTAMTPSPAEQNQQFEVFDAAGNRLGVYPLADVMELKKGDGTLFSRPVGAIGTAKPGPIAQKEYGSHQEYVQDLNKKVSEGERLISTQDEMLTAMERARTGPAAEQRTVMARWAQALGFSAEHPLVKDLQGGNDELAVAAAEQIKKMQFDMALARARQSMPAGTQLTNAETFRFDDTTPGLAMNPQAAKLIFGFERKKIEYDRAERDFLLEHKDMSPNEARTAWTKEALKRGLISTVKPPVGESPPLVKPGERDPRLPAGPAPSLREFPVGRTMEVQSGGKTYVVRRTGPGQNDFKVLGVQ